MPLAGMEIGHSPFTFVPIAEICGGSHDLDYLVDVIGMLTGVGTERAYDRNGTSTNLNVLAIEEDGNKLQCTLFGSYVDDLNTYLAAGDTANTVMAIQLAKVKTFQDNIHIQNCISCTRVVFNPICAEATAHMNRMVDNIETPSPYALTQIPAQPTVAPLEEFLCNTQRRHQGYHL